MADASSAAPVNTLGLDFEQSKEKAEDEPKLDEEKKPDSKGQRKKVEQYVNPERVKTGGNPRDKLTDEALSERMARIKEQNEKIKQRRLDVQADEDAFKETAEAEKVKHAQLQTMQKDINLKREQNAKRKMEKIQSREWDSPKADRRPQNSKPAAVAGGEEPAAESQSTSATTGASDADRGSWRGRGGRGRGRGNTRPAGGQKKPAAAAAAATETETTVEPAKAEPQGES